MAPTCETRDRKKENEMLVKTNSVKELGLD